MHFLAFLKQVTATYPTGVLYLELDGAPAHTAKVVRKWLEADPGVVVLWLPKYSAHKHNPVERVWGRMKDTVAANRLAGSIEELTAYARRFFTDLTPCVTPQEAA